MYSVLPNKFSALISMTKWLKIKSFKNCGSSK